MQKKTKIILASTLVGIPLLGYMGYRYVLANYELKPSGGSIENIDKENQLLYGNIEFTLSSSIGIGFVVKDIELDVFLQGIKVGHISKTDKIVVPNNGKTVISIPIVLDLASLKSNALSFVTSALTGGGVSISIDGYSKAYISGLPIGVNVSVNESFEFFN